MKNDEWGEMASEELEETEGGMRYLDIEVWVKCGEGTGEWGGRRGTNCQLEEKLPEQEW